MMKDFSKYKKYSLSIIFISVLLFGIGAYINKDLNFNHNIETYFPKGDENVEFYREYSEKFEKDADIFLLAIEHDSSIFDTTFLRKVRNLERELENLDKIIQVNSPFDLKRLIKTPMGFSEIPVLHISDKYLKRDSSFIFSDGKYVGSYFSSHNKAICFFVRNQTNLSKEEGDKHIANVYKIVDSYGFYKITESGRITAQNFYIETMSNEFKVFSAFSIILLIVFLLSIYKSTWPIWMSMIILGLSITVTIAAILKCEGELNMLMTILPILIFVIGVSDVIHILTKYIEELRSGKEKTHALEITLKEVGLATFLTSLTTSIGFLSLLTSDSIPIQKFGTYVALGVMVTYIISITLLPAMLFFYKTPNISTKKAEKLFLNTLLRKWFVFVFAKRTKIALATVLIVGVSVVGLFKMEINNYFFDDLCETSSLKQKLNYFESTFEGIRPFELSFKTKDSSSILEYNNIKEFERIQDFVKKEYDLGPCLSVVTIIKTANQAYNSGDKKHFVIPDEKKYNKLISKLKRFGFIKKMGPVLTKSQNWGRISTKVDDFGSAVMRKKGANFDKFMKESTTDIYDLRITAVPTLLDQTNENITFKLIKGLSLAIGVVALIIGFLYRSVRIVFISLIPNLIPLLILGGFIGFMGIDVKISTGIVFTIAFGIAVDDTIHFLSKLRIELNKGKSLVYSIKRTFLSTGKAIILTSVILSSGFVSLSFSSFESTLYIGILICITLVLAVLADLFLLPLLLLKFYKKKDE